MRRRNLLLTSRIATALASLLCASAAIACPNCADQVANSDSAGGPALSGAFNASIYVMLGAFLCVVALVVGVILKGIKGADATTRTTALSE